MNKRKRIEWIHNEIKASGRSFKVLSENDQGPQHIRVVGVGDIWPSTGTYSVKGKFVKGNPSQFIALCGGNSEAPKVESKYDRLEKRVIKIEEICALFELLESRVLNLEKLCLSLEKEIERLKN